MLYENCTHQGQEGREEGESDHMNDLPELAYPPENLNAPEHSDAEDVEELDDAVAARAEDAEKSVPMETRTTNASRGVHELAKKGWTAWAQKLKSSSAASSVRKKCQWWVSVSFESQVCNLNNN